MAGTTAEEITVRDMVQKIGMQLIMDRLGVSDVMVRTVVRKNQMPPGWFAVMDELCQSKDLGPVRRDLFDFKTPIVTALNPKISGTIS